MTEYCGMVYLRQEHPISPVWYTDSAIEMKACKKLILLANEHFFALIEGKTYLKLSCTCVSLAHLSCQYCPAARSLNFVDKGRKARSKTILRLQMLMCTREKLVSLLGS